MHRPSANHRLHPPGPGRPLGRTAVTTGRARPPGGRGWALWATALVACIGAGVVTEVYLWVPLITPVAAAWDLPVRVAALPGTACTLGYAAGFVLLGRLSARWGPALLVRGLAVTGLAALASAAVTGPVPVSIARLLVGVAGASFAPTALAWLAAQVGDRFRPVAVGVVSAALLLAAPLAQSGSAALATDRGWRVVLVGAGLLHLAAVPILAFALRASRSAPLLSAANVGQHRTVRLLRQPRLRWLYASTLGGLFGLLVLYTGLGSLPGWADAAKLRLVTAPALLLAVPSGLLVAHRGPRGSLLAGPLLIGAGIVLAAVGLRGMDVGLLAAGTAAAAGGSAVLIPALITAVQQEVDAAAGPAARAWAAALYLAALFTGVAAASPVALVAGTRLPELLAALAIPTALSALLARQPRHR